MEMIFSNLLFLMVNQQQVIEGILFKLVVFPDHKPLLAFKPLNGFFECENFGFQSGYDAIISESLELYESNLYFSHLCMMNSQFPLITVLGPTAGGKTVFAAHLALAVNGEIISADSRQVFRGMDLGTGKDIGDYKIADQVVTSHLIDIADPGTEYNVFRFQHDFQAACSSIISRGKTPLLCGGTGLYLEAVILDYDLNEVPHNTVLRQELAAFTDEELITRLSELRPLHNTTDILDRDRLVKAIEIELFKQNNIKPQSDNDFRKTPVFGIRFSRKTERERITARLTQRLNEGMIDEIQQLLDKGISKERLIFYGLEYKYVTMYLTGDLAFDQMFSLLNTAIHQFSKRQMTWFRRMEKKGINIKWLEGEDGLQVNLQKAIDYLKSYQGKMSEIP
jgi:tRNA dimethylallyltransferase